MLLVFFFQAEDGIRVHCVTGVQTCALPIFSGRMPASISSFVKWPGPEATPPITLQPGSPRRIAPDATRSHFTRSEERRVGKECRSGWRREPEKQQARSERKVR